MAAGETPADTTTEKERADVVAALGALTTVLFPHLDREVASACLTHAEWRAVEQACNIKAKSWRRYRRQARERWGPDPSPTLAGRR